MADKLKLVRKQMIEKVRHYCEENRLFCNGTVYQYNKMLDFLYEGSSLHDIAIIIWICSDSEEFSIEKIEDYLDSLENGLQKHIK